jgi:DNA-binding response OmpR family regulator
MLANEKESRVLSWDHENKPIGAAERPGVGIHVLLVDDITDVRESVAEGLKEMGYGVTLASSGSEALTHLKKGTFDVVISDLNMADGDGLDLRAHAREKNLPTIMISGYPEKYLPFIKEDIFLQKPFYMKELVNAIRSIKRK